MIKQGYTRTRGIRNIYIRFTRVDQKGQRRVAGRQIGLGRTVRYGEASA